MIKSVDTLGEIDRRPASFLAKSLYRHARALVEKLHLRNLVQDKEKIPNFVLIQDTENQEMEVFSHLIMTFVLSTMRMFNYNARRKSMNWEANAAMRKKRVLLKSKRDFSNVKSVSSN